MGSLHFGGRMAYLKVVSSKDRRSHLLNIVELLLKSTAASPTTVKENRLLLVPT